MIREQFGHYEPDESLKVQADRLFADGHYQEAAGCYERLSLREYKAPGRALFFRPFIRIIPGWWTCSAII